MAQNVIIQGWTPQVNGRGTLDILWTCALTIILCCWTSVCVNVPSLKDDRWDRFRDKFFIALVGILGPDFLMILAMGQWESARNSVRKFNAAKLTNKKWTMRQAFFADMGGYLLQVPDFRDPFPIHTEQLYFLISKGYIEVPPVDEAEINDKNKRDGLARLLTVAQAFIFGASTLARFSQHLATTTLEITTLAFIFADVATSCFWMYKPQDITRPVILESQTPMAEILRKAGITSPDDYTYTPMDFLNPEAWFCSVYWTKQIQFFRRIFQFSLVKVSTTRPVDRLRSDNFPPLSLPYMEFGIELLILLYSAIFLCAWNNHFPSQTERMLWRVTSIITLGFAFLGGALFFYIDVYIIRNNKKDGKAIPGIPKIDEPSSSLPYHDSTRPGRTRTNLDRESVIPMAFLVPSSIFGGIYCIARAYILVEDMIGLRSLPASAFATVDWTTYLPHS